MITLDQIKQLDFKVRKAIDKITSLKSENDMLQKKMDDYQLRIEELEILIDTFKEDQGEIEEGIIDALNQLDILEDNLSSTVADEADNSEIDQESAEDTQELKNHALKQNDNESEIFADSSDVDIIDEEESDPEVDSTKSEIELDIF